METGKDIRDEYRVTWEAFSRRLSEYQARIETGDSASLDAALNEVVRARREHNAARDRLAREITAQ